MGDKTRGDVAIQGLWKRGETCILDICVTDTDTKAYKVLSLRGVIEAPARVKKAKYLKACPDQQRTFVSLAYSVDGMVGVEARVFEKCIAFLLALKLNQEYSKLVVFTRMTMAMVAVRAITRLLRDARLKLLKWIIVVDGAALEGFPGLREL